MIRTKVVKRAIVLGDGLGASMISLELAGQGHEVELLMPGDEPIDLSLFAFPDEQSRSGASAKMKSIVSSSKIRMRSNCLVTSIEGCAGDFEMRFNDSSGSKSIRAGAIALAQDPSPSVRDYGVSVISNSELRGMVETDAEIPRTVVFIEGSGARGRCPAQMTTASIENGLAVKRKRPDSQVYILARDVAAPGTFEQAYLAAQEKGVVFFRGDFSYRMLKEDPGSLIITDPVVGDVKIRPDLMVRDDTFDLVGDPILARKLGLRMDHTGKVLGLSTRFHPGETTREGVFICHGLGASILASDNISEACAVASSIAELLSKDFLEHGAEAAFVDKEKCSACLACVRICPYDAPFIGDKGKAEILVTSCQGCGMCVSLCPSKAIDQRNWTDAKMSAETAIASKGGNR